jgi:catechol 2,3-dioxygenase-like lactoylglutathione lyase family enzyme
VPDVAAARAACDALDIRILSDLGHFFFTHPRDGFGFSWELWDGDWDAPGPDFPDFVPVHPDAYWRHEHPLGVTGLGGLRVAVPDLGAAIAHFDRVFGAAVVYRDARPAIGAEAAGVGVGETAVELLAPTGPGEVTDFLERYGPRLRSVVFDVDDLDRAQRHLDAIGIPLTDGDDAKSRLLAPRHNHGLRIELRPAG